MAHVTYSRDLMRQVIRGEVWFRKCPDCETTGVDYKNKTECEECEGLGYIPIQGHKP